MAILVGSPIGNLRGKLGPLYARITRGMTILSILPTRSSESFSEVPTDKQKKFAVTIRLAKNLIRFNEIKNIWKSNLNGFSAPYNYIIHKNFEQSSVDSPTESNVITPSGFNAAVTDITLSDFDLTASVAPLNQSTYISENEVSVLFTGAIVFSNPSDPKDELFEVTPLNKAVSNYNFSNPYSLTYSLDPVQKTFLTRYQKMIVFLTVITKDASNKTVQFSRTISATI